METTGEMRHKRFDLSSFVSARFDDYTDAESATVDLLRAGFERDRLTILVSEESRKRILELQPEIADPEEESRVTAAVELEQENKGLKGAGVGGSIGGTVGAVAAGIAAIGTSVVIPPLGLVVAGPLAAALAGAGAGGAAGTVIGALTGAGLDEYRARSFAEIVDDGQIIVGAHALTVPEQSEIVRILEERGGTIVAPGIEESE
jgi:hypothetical protein